MIWPRDCISSICLRLLLAPLESWGQWSPAQPTSTTLSRGLDVDSHLRRSRWFCPVFQIVNFTCFCLGRWSEQEVRQDHWHCCWSPSQVWNVHSRDSFCNGWPLGTRVWSLCSWTHRGWRSSSRRWSCSPSTPRSPGRATPLLRRCPRLSSWLEPRWPIKSAS